MKNYWILIVGILGALGVITGAFGAHSLKEALGPEHGETWNKAVQYQFIHVLAMVGVLALAGGAPTHRTQKLALWFFFAGILMFSGSLYLLATRHMTNLPEGFTKAIGPITPLGGLCFIVGWISLGLTARAKSGMAAVVVLGLGIASCGASGNGDLVSRIPADADGVIVINMPKIAATAADGKHPFFESWVGQMTYGAPMLRKAITSPTACGVDIQKKAYAGFHSGEMPLSMSSIMFLFPLKDAKLWEKTITELGGKTSGSKLKTVTGMGDAIMMYDEKAAYIFSPMDGGEENPFLSCASKAPSKSITGNKRFSEALKNDHDLGVWLQTEGLARQIGSDAAAFELATGIKADWVKDNAAMLYFDFAAGEMRSGVDFNLNPNLRSFLEGYTKPWQGGFPAELIPAKGLSSLVCASVNAEKATQLPMVGPILNQYMGVMGNQATGCIALAMYKGSRPMDEHFTVAVGVNDGSQMNRILGEAVAKGDLVKAGNDYRTRDNEQVISVQGNWLYIGDKSYTPAGNDRLSDDQWKTLTASPVGFLAPTGGAELALSYLPAFGSALQSPEAGPVMEKYMEKADASVDLNGVHLNLHFRDKSANGMTQLLTILQEAEVNSAAAGKGELDRLLLEEAQ